MGDEYAHEQRREQRAQAHADSKEDAREEEALATQARQAWQRYLHEMMADSPSEIRSARGRRPQRPKPKEAEARGEVEDDDAKV